MKTQHAAEQIGEDLSADGPALPEKGLWTWPDRLGSGGTVALFIVVATTYAIGARLAFALIVSSGLDGVFFIPAGITAAFLLRLPRRHWATVLLGAGVTEAAMDLANGFTFAQSLGFAAANVAEPLLGALIVTSAIGVLDLARRKHVVFFIVGSVLAGPALGALIGAGADRMFGGDDFLATFGQWWLGDALGVVIVGGSIVAWGPSPDRRTLGSLPGAALLAGSAVLTGYAMIGTDLPIVFMSLIGIVVAGVVFGPRAVAMTALTVAVTVALSISLFSGDLIVGLTRGTALLIIKIEVGLFALAGLVVAAEAHERELASRRASASELRAALIEKDRQQEHEIALRLQRALLPSELLQDDRFRMAARYEAASDMLEVGGDWYDSIRLDRGRVGIVVGDVVGHGIEAATSMGRLRSAFAALAISEESPMRLLTELDRFAGTQGGTAFATAVYGILDPVGELRYASAGHPPPLVLPRHGSPYWVDGARSQPLYGESRTPRREAVARIEPDSTIIFYSDGLVERRGEPIEVGLGRLETEAGALRNLDPDELCRQLVTRMGVGSERNDDVVVVAVRLLSLESPHRDFRLDIPAVPTELKRLRDELRSWLKLNQLTGQVETDLLLTVGEACSNAVRHAYPEDRPGLCTVALQIEEDHVRVRVIDYGTWHERAKPDGYTGRGTDIMRSVSSDFSRETGADGTTVSFRIPIKHSKLKR